MTLPEAIRLCRTSAGLTQQALADAIGVSRVSVANWETGRHQPTVGSLDGLEAVTGVNPYVLAWLSGGGDVDSHRVLAGQHEERGSV